MAWDSTEHDKYEGLHVDDAKLVEHMSLPHVLLSHEGDIEEKKLLLVGHVHNYRLVQLGTDYPEDGSYELDGPALQTPVYELPEVDQDTTGEGQQVLVVVAELLDRTMKLYCLIVQY